MRFAPRDWRYMRCECGAEIGSLRETGFLIGNLIMQRFAGACAHCGRPQKWPLPPSEITTNQPAKIIAPGEKVG